MPISPVDYDPFSPDYGGNEQFTQPTRGRQPMSPAQEPAPFVDSDYSGRQQRMDNDPGVRTARGLVRRGEKAGEDMIFQGLRKRFINNPQALSMLKYLQAQQGYNRKTADALSQVGKPAPRFDQPQVLPRGDEQAQIMPTGPARQHPMMQQPQPQPQPQQPQIPQQQYRSMRPAPGMVVNGYRLVNPSKPNDRASWQPVTEK